MVREESTDCPLRETLSFIVSCGAIGSSDRKVGSAASVCVCVCVCVSVCVRAHWHASFAPKSNE